MEMRPFGINPLTGAVETFYYDHANDTFTIETRENVTPLIEENKAFMSDAGGNGWKGDLHRVASIPFTVLPQLEKLGIMTSGGRILDAKRLKKWLNDSENNVFRTRPGRI